MKIDLRIWKLIRVVLVKSFFDLVFCKGEFVEGYRGGLDLGLGGVGFRYGLYLDVGIRGNLGYVFCFYLNFILFYCCSFFSV